MIINCHDIVRNIESLITSNDCKKFHLFHIYNSILYQYIWRYDLSYINNASYYSQCLPVIVVEVTSSEHKLLMYNYYECKQDDNIVEVLTNYLSVNETTYKDSCCLDESSMDSALTKVKYTVLTEKNVNKELLIDILEKNLKWINDLQLNTRIQNKLENKQIDSMIKSIVEM